MIYLDYAADTPACQAALDALVGAAQTYGANPNASHALGQAARARLDAATQHIAELLGCQAEEWVLTSGATEANNMAILGVAHAYRSRGQHIITTHMEHASVTGAVMALKAEGYSVDFAQVDAQGQVDTAHLRSLLREDTLLVSVCAVDSEVGVMQPITAIREVLAGYPGCRLHVDATQAVGKLPLDLSGADLFTLSPHKFYGITGTGMLVVRGGLRLAPLWYGGTGATPYRSGTPALALTLACEAALQEALAHLPERLAAVRMLQARLRAGLAALPFVTLNTPADASPYTLNVSVHGLRARELIALLSERGVCVSSKSACCAPAAPSHPVLAMTGDRKRAMNTVRLSLSHLTTGEEIDSCLRIFTECAYSLEVARG